MGLADEMREEAVRQINANDEKSANNHFTTLINMIQNNMNNEQSYLKLQNEWLIAFQGGCGELLRNKLKTEGFNISEGFDFYELSTGGVCKKDYVRINWYKNEEDK